MNLVTLVKSAAFEAADGGEAAGEVGVEGLAEAGLEVAEGGEVAGEVGLEGLAETGLEVGVEVDVEAAVEGVLAETGMQGLSKK